MAMVALLAVADARNLKKAILWRRHSTQVILAIQSFQADLVDIQQNMRGYVTLGNSNDLSSYHKSVTLEKQEFNRLVTLTADNPQQQQRLTLLASAVNAVVSYDDRAVAVYRQQGYAGIAKLTATDEGRTLFGRVRAILERFSAEEEKLSEVRDVSEQNQYRYTGHWLVIGSLLAAALLLYATVLAGHELSFRQRAEAKLKETLLLQNAILASADYGIVATDPTGVVQTFNHAAERLLGYSAAEVVGKATPVLWRDPDEISAYATSLSEKLGTPIAPTFEAIVKKAQSGEVDEGEGTFIRKDGGRFPCLIVVTQLADEKGRAAGYLGIFRDISIRKKIEAERESLIIQLQKTLAEIKTLSGLIPICAWCKNVRSDSGYWQTVEQYVRSHSDASFSHGVCPNCAAKFKDDILRANQKAGDAVSL